MQRKVSFLGHVISPEGITTDPDKTSKVALWPNLTCRHDVQQFLGLANDYRRFIRNFADIAKPLHRLTEKTATFSWSEHCQHAFDELRRLLTSALILAFPDTAKHFTLDTDASGSGIGAVLSQTQEDGKERVVAYASRMLSKPECRYCTTRRELLAVVAFTKHFRPYLLGRKFTVQTDHGSLTWFRNFKQPEGQLARWIEQLQEYDFEVIHRRGVSHGNADALSRRPCPQCGRDSHNDTPDPVITAPPADVQPDLTHPVVTTKVATDQVVEQPAEITTDPAVTTPLAGVVRPNMTYPVATTNVATDQAVDTDTAMQHSQQEDPEVGVVLSAIHSNTMPDANVSASMGREGRSLLQQWDQMELHNGKLLRRFHHTDGSHSHLQLVAPTSCCQQVQMQEMWGDTLVNVRPSVYCVPDFTGQGMPQMLRTSVAPAMCALPESPLFPQEEPTCIRLVQLSHASCSSGHCGALPHYSCRQQVHPGSNGLLYPLG